jgi:hypothetical protein
MFRIVPTGISGGTSLRGEIELPPAFMIERFGEHDGGDRSSTSGGWTFASESGEVFTVYESRCTTLSNGRWSGSPTEEAFWASWTHVSFHIGGMPGSAWQAFRRWLQAEYRAFRKGRGEGPEPDVPIPPLDRLVARVPRGREPVSDQNGERVTFVSRFLRELTPKERREVLQSLAPEELLAAVSAEETAKELKKLQSEPPSRKGKPRRKS